MSDKLTGAKWLKDNGYYDDYVSIWGDMTKASDIHISDAMESYHQAKMKEESMDKAEPNYPTVAPPLATYNPLQQLSFADLIELHKYLVGWCYDAKSFAELDEFNKRLHLIEDELKSRTKQITGLEI